MDKKIIMVVLITAMGWCYSSAQDIYYTKTGRISFYSKAPLEDIEAHNDEVVSFIDVKKNEVAFSLLIKGFHFKKALMEQHFNTSYMESDKYPKATFSGTVTDAGSLKLGVDGKYPVKVSGKLMIHNVTKDVTADALVIVQGKKLSGQAKFKVKLADFQVKIPSVVSQNIAEVIDVTVDCNYIPLEK